MVWSRLAKSLLLYSGIARVTRKQGGDISQPSCFGARTGQIKALTTKTHFLVFLRVLGIVTSRSRASQELWLHKPSEDTPPQKGRPPTLIPAYLYMKVPYQVSKNSHQLE